MRPLLPALIAGLSLASAGQVLAQPFRVLHAFTAAAGSNGTNNDGANPSAGLLLAGDTLYGTARYGGSAGWGTVFAVGTNGVGFTALHHFTGSQDGANPSAGLVLSNDTLYGTAYAGGSSDAGTLFAINADGTGFTNLHPFTATADNSFGFFTNSEGANPSAGLVLAGSRLYGTANAGGTSGHGTVFALSTDGSAFTTLHSFSSGSGGPYSSADLVLSGNTLYGTDYANLGNGTVFALYTNGAGFTNLYAFTSGKFNGNGILTNSDGAHPHAGLILAGTTFYGTAEHGGRAGQGTVFALNTDGTGFTNLHSFTAGAYNAFGLYTNTDGAHPAASLILSSNTLYGTATDGGNSGNGTVFAFGINGAGFTNLHGFGATPAYPAPQTNSDGANPSAGLVLAGNAVFGTTAYGGSAGNGTVFCLSLAPATVTGLRLSALSAGTNVVLTWPPGAAGLVLQSAPDPTGTFTNIPGATSPYTNPASGAQQFFRLSQAVP